MSSAHRTDFTAGLRALADFLDANPAVPIPEFSAEILIHIYGTDDEQRIEVDRVAELLGVSVLDETTDGGHYKAIRFFGPVEYRCVAVPAAAMALHHARWAYACSVVPDQAA